MKQILKKIAPLRGL